MGASLCTKREVSDCTETINIQEIFQDGLWLLKKNKKKIHRLNVKKQEKLIFPKLHN